jgi:uncharacterized pyridoxamine 5'-phosphate oxidase family protein
MKDGLYFMTNDHQALLPQLKETGKVSVCGLCANSAVKQTERNQVRCGYISSG